MRGRYAPQTMGQLVTGCLSVVVVKLVWCQPLVKVLHFRSYQACPRWFVDLEELLCAVCAGMCRHQQQSLDPKLQRVVAISVARGMAYLHSRCPPILHLVSACQPASCVPPLAAGAWCVYLQAAAVSRCIRSCGADMPSCAVLWWLLVCVSGPQVPQHPGR